VCGQLGLTLSKIILCENGLSRLAKGYFPNVSIRVTKEEEALRVPGDELDGVKVIYLERAPIETKHLNALIQKGRHLEVIVISRWKYAYKWKAPRNWRLTEVKVAHTTVGGVTNATCRFFAIRRTRQSPGEDSELRIAARPARDARSILKMARPGIKAVGPEYMPFDAAVVPVFESSGVMSCDSIVPYPKRPGEFREFVPRVLTKYGGELWVKRSFEAKELLIAGDVPEKIIHLASTSQEVDRMVNVLDWPVKMLQAVAEGIDGILDKSFACLRAGSKRNRTPGTTDGLNDGVKRLRLKETDEDECRDPVESENAMGGDPIREEVSLEAENDHQAKAVKNDNARVRSKDWDFFLALGLDDEIRARDWREAAVKIRPLAMRWWRRHQLRKCLEFKRIKTITGEFTEFDRGAMVDAADRMASATWWSWNNGSRPFYWAWDEDKQIPMRDGINLWIRERMIPSWVRPQEPPKDPETFRKVVDKLLNAREKGYISMGVVKSLIFFFDVPKGLDDIRMVYDGTKSGLNAELWAPWFPLPTVDLLLQSVEACTYMSDNDVGEMFLNFVLHSSVQERCGVDLTKFFPDEIDDDNNIHKERQVRWERWTPCAMGLRTSPYQAVQGMLWAMERSFGDQNQDSNVFSWKYM
jgi:hypothetical protein